MTTLTTRKKKISSSKNAKSKGKSSTKEESNIAVYFKNSLEVQTESREDDKHLQDAKENLIIPETRKSRHLASGISRRSLSVPPPRLTTRKNKPPTELNADQRKITDYLSQRRSGRTTEKEIKKKEQEELQRMIVDQTRETGDEDLEVVQITGKGRGVVAKRSFSRGEFMVEYAGDLIELSTAKQRESQYKLSPSYGCYMYYFSHNSKRYCIDATEETGRLGRLVNHSRLNPNCKTTVVDVRGVPRLVLVANKMIERGEELLYDYGDRRKESLQDHPWLAL